LGDYLWLTPTKLGGGAQVQDLATGKTLAWIEYWNYGDSCPIAHHLAAFPSPDPRIGFEFVNSTQGGQNVLIYGIPTEIREHGMLDPIWGQGNQIYRVGFDGQQMNLLENIAETTGIGVGVHTVIFPDASGFSCSDGQKDVVAFFTRATGPQKTKVIAAFRFDWYGNETDGALEDNWFKGGKVRITKLVVAPETGLYDYRGTKGNKLDWEMVPMGEYLVYTGQLPGDAVRRLTGSDNCVHHPIHPLSLVTLRMFAGQRWHLGDQTGHGVDLGPRVRLWPERQVVRHDQQHPAKQHGCVQLCRFRPAKMDANHGFQGLPLGRVHAKPVPHRVLNGRLKNVCLRAAPETGEKRHSCRRYCHLDDDQALRKRRRRLPNDARNL
jgi:hypothetical protein